MNQLSLILNNCITDILFAVNTIFPISKFKTISIQLLKAYIGFCFVKSNLKKIHYLSIEKILVCRRRFTIFH